MISTPSDNVDKIDFEDLIKDFRIVSIDELANYLKEIWKVNKFKLYFKKINFIGFITKKRKLS